MFYSHQLLARKAPLGQIWMAATMHAKINRRKLDKLDIIKICEEILNPSVPMALRLSGILMGGVVIVYERKVKLLYDDVTRFLVEINEAWKVKAVTDPTILPKNKTQAKYEAVTLPNDIDMEAEQPMFFSGASVTTAKLKHMRLDLLDELYTNINPREDDPSDDYHQAEAANITLFEDFGSCLAETDFYNRFERFDIGDEETQVFSPQEPPRVPTTLIPSPPPQDDHTHAPTSLPSSPPPADPPEDIIAKDHQTRETEEEHAAECRNESQGLKEDVQKERLAKRKAHDTSHVIMDNEQIMIPGCIYQSWLLDASNIVSKRGRRTKPLNPIQSTKISSLMNLPPVALITGLDKFSGGVQYPAPLMELWRKWAESDGGHGLPSGVSTDAQQNPVSHSPPVEMDSRGQPEFLQEEFQSHVGSPALEFSIEKLRANLENMVFQGVNEASLSNPSVTPGSPGQSSRSIPSSGSANSFMQMEPEVQPPSGRSKRKPHSSSRSSLGNLDTVAEEYPLQQSVRDFKIRRLSEEGPTPDFELIEETGPTQTPRPVTLDSSADRITESIRIHLKMHFDTPGASPSESLNYLALGMNRRKAAQLFYQTCVLATFNFVRVQQTDAYGDILISRGPKM